MPIKKFRFSNYFFYEKCKDRKWIRNVALFLFSQTVSILGSSVVSFSIFWYLTLKYSSGIIITILILCTFIPQTVISLFAGVWADRYKKKYIIILSDFFIALATFGLVLLMFYGYESLIIIYAATIIRSIGSGIQSPSVSSLIPEITPKEYLSKVNGLNNTLNSGVMLLSPAIGGVILGTSGIMYSLMFDVITAVIGIGILSVLNMKNINTVSDSEWKKDENRNENLDISYNDTNREKNSNRKNDNNSQKKNLMEGLYYIKNNYAINQILKLFTLVYIIVTPVAFLYPLLIEQTYGKDIGKITVTEILWSLGMILGGFIVIFTKKIKNKIKVLLWINFFLGIDFFIMGALVHNYFILLLTLFLGGIFIIIGDTAETVFIQENTDSEVMGRVFSMIHMIRSLVFPLSILVFGPLSDFTGVKILICVSSIFLSLVSFIKLLNKKFVSMGKN